jgi:hypothetical protein
VVEVKIPSNEIQKCRDKRDIWRYPNRDLILDDYTHEIYEVIEPAALRATSSYGYDW